jgi:hypothetical protein
MRWSRTHLSPTPSSRSIGAAPSATVAAASSSTESIRRRPYNPFISLAKPQNATPAPQFASEPNRARGSGAGPGRERGGGARRERRDVFVSCGSPRHGSVARRSTLLYFFRFPFAEQGEFVRDTISFRFILAFFLGQEGLFPTSTVPGRSRRADLVCNERSAVPGIWRLAVDRRPAKLDSSSHACRLPVIAYTRCRRARSYANQREYEPIFSVKAQLSVRASFWKW